MIVLGAGMPERQRSNREVVRSQRKKQMREIPAGANPTPEKTRGRREKTLGLVCPR